MGKRSAFYRFVIFFWLLLLTLFLSACSLYIPSDFDHKGQEPETAPEIAVLPEPRIETISLGAAGDVLMHNTQYWGALQKDGSYDFTSFFTPVEHLLKSADYTSTNFEAPMAGAEIGYSNFPLFNSPDAIAETFKASGFDLIVTANNHILDQGPKGALRTLQVLKNSGLDTTGCFASLEEQKTPLIKTIRDIKVGYLAYTYGTNGIPLPQGTPLINILDPDTVLEDIAQVRPQVDVLILILHWGEEYSPRATPQQKELARTFLGAGADAILGSHPHVIAPMEVININGHNKFVIYSMGNFISAQNGLERNSGVILNLKFKKDFTSDQTKLTGVSYVPTYSHPYFSGGKRQYRVVPVVETIEKIENGTEPFLAVKDLPILNRCLTQTKQVLGEEFRIGE